MKGAKIEGTTAERLNSWFKSTLSPENKFLLQCIAPSEIQPPDDQGRHLLGAPLDWDAITRTAHKHQILPLVYLALKEGREIHVPAAVQLDWQARYHAISERNGELAKRMLLTLDCLSEGGICGLPIKGPILAHAVYGDLSHRQFADVDILVNDSDYSRTQRLLELNAYHQCNEHGWQSSWIHSSDKISIDLHRRITPSWFSLPFEFEKAWERRQQLMLLDQVVFQPSSLDTFVILSVQLARNACEHDLKISKILDLHRFLSREDQLDWNLVFETASDLRSNMIFQLGLSVCSAVFGGANARIEREKLSDTRVAESTKNLCLKLFGESAVPSSRMVNRVHWTVREKYRDKLWPYLLCSALWISRNTRVRTILKRVFAFFPRFLRSY